MTSEFTTKSGLSVGSVSLTALNAMRTGVRNELGITTPQIVEGASFSMAMVARAALGLSAAGGVTCGIVRDNLSGWIVLATLRHLINGGADAQVILVAEVDHSPDLNLQLKPLERMGIPIYDWSPSPDQGDLTQLLQSCHNTLVGLFDSLSPIWNDNLVPLVEVLNDVPTPSHTVELPYGVDPNTGRLGATPLFASSTLALGAPLSGLVNGFEQAGRLYCCDVSISHGIYKQQGLDVTGLFSDQPVVQLLKGVNE